MAALPTLWPPCFPAGHINVGPVNGIHKLDSSHRKGNGSGYKDNYSLMAASSNSHTLRDLLLEAHKALGVLAPWQRIFSNANVPVTRVGSVRTTLAGLGAGWILVGHKKHKLYCSIWHFWVFCYYSPILTRSLLPAYPTGCFKRFGSLQGKAALAGNWTPDISVAAIPTRVITISLLKGLFPSSPFR